MPHREDIAGADDDAIDVRRGEMLVAAFGLGNLLLAGIVNEWPFVGTNDVREIRFATYRVCEEDSSQPVGKFALEQDAPKTQVG